MYALVRPLTIPDIVEQQRSKLIEDAPRFLAVAITNPGGIHVVVDIVHEVMNP